MRAYYYDNVPGDQRLLHDSGRPVSAEELRAIDVASWKIPIDDEGKWQARIDEVAQERGYKNRDVINVTKAGLGDAYEAKIKMFFEE
jgi:1,2-dihydroxy-3-keto-5-methylthiopentene dioxygenase